MEAISASGRLPQRLELTLSCHFYGNSWEAALDRACDAVQTVNIHLVKLRRKVHMLCKAEVVLSPQMKARACQRAPDANPMSTGLPACAALPEATCNRTRRARRMTEMILRGIFISSEGRCSTSVR
ncbi:hypothetical protein CVIRNUC_007159 [Coccomyxa viridis]|uniref:Uncharacterized protein n=1 Tax=Coccomyxa viridis TaxID=1274662 RepID=A0AAV1IAR5_9CHLO|nr:hypothetical protein CVIRNUC_007159 [Coccomyxa viridis]